MKLKGSYKWPKELPSLTEEQQKIRDDFMKFWLQRLAANQMYTPLEGFNHGYPIRHAPGTFNRTLEIGAGLGEHLSYEKLSREQRENYVALDLRTNMVEALRERHPDIVTYQGDCQKRIDFPDDSFDRILAIHVLEHLPNLPATVSEMYRLCNKQTGVFCVVIPCEGGLMYSLARLISTERMFRKRYGQSYKWCIESEHISIPGEIFAELKRYFEPVNTEFFPFLVPFVWLNLVIGITLRPKDPAQVQAEN